MVAEVGLAREDAGELEGDHVEGFAVNIVSTLGDDQHWIINHLLVAAKSQRSSQTTHASSHVLEVVGHDH